MSPCAHEPINHMSTSTETIEQLATREYRVRLLHRYRSRNPATRPERGRDPGDFGEEARARVAARLPPEGVSRRGSRCGSRPGTTSITTRSTTRPSATTRRRRRSRSSRASTRWIPSCAAPSRSWVSRWRSRSSWPASPSTPCSTPSRSRPRSAASWPSSASSSALSAKRCRSIQSWCGSISARWCRTPTTSLRR